MERVNNPAIVKGEVPSGIAKKAAQRNAYIKSMDFRFLLRNCPEIIAEIVDKWLIRNSFLGYRV